MQIQAETLQPLTSNTATRSAEPLVSLREAEDRARALVEELTGDLNAEHEDTAPIPINTLNSPDRTIQMDEPRDVSSHERLAIETIQVAGNHLADNRVADAARLRRAQASTRGLNLAQDGSGATINAGMLPTTISSTRNTDAGTNYLTQELARAMPSIRTADLHADSIALPRLRPAIGARDPYARNNDFLARMAAAERLDNEIGRLQRPTPPPAIGHGRPGSTGNDLPRTRSRPSEPLPRWQRDQENSEEAAMSRFIGDVRDMMITQASNDGEYDHGVMDNTPPREHPIHRYLHD
jgi:hypothetical protein